MSPVLPPQAAANVPNAAQPGAPDWRTRRPLVGAVVSFDLDGPIRSTNSTALDGSTTERTAVIGAATTAGWLLERGSRVVVVTGPKDDAAAVQQWLTENGFPAGVEVAAHRPGGPLLHVAAKDLPAAPSGMHWHDLRNNAVKAKTGKPWT